MSNVPSLRRIRFRRVLRRLPRQVLELFFSPLSDETQFLSALVSLISSYLAVRFGVVEFDVELNSWTNFLQACAIAAVFWAGFALVRAPFVVLRKEALEGRWIGNRFVFHQPKLVFVQRCRATGKMEKYPFHCSGAEPDSFIHYELQADGYINRELISAAVTGDIILGSFSVPGAGLQQAGCRIGADGMAMLVVTMREDAASQTLRVFILDFSIGNPEERDGEVGTR